LCDGPALLLDLANGLDQRAWRDWQNPNRQGESCAAGEPVAVVIISIQRSRVLSF